MKPLLLLCLLFTFSTAMHGQDSWTILLHKKTLLTGKGVDEQKNTRLIRSIDWKKTGKLEIRYREEPASNWIHSIRLTDELETTFFSQDSTLSTSISTTQLRKLFAGKKQIKIFMVINPPNPQIAAPSRMIHLATLKLP